MDVNDPGGNHETPCVDDPSSLRARQASHRLDLVALMEGRASNPAAWPAPFTINPSADDRRIGLIDLGDDHFVRADLSVRAESLIA